MNIIQLKKKWKDILSRTIFTLEKTEKNMIYIKLVDIPDELYSDLLQYYFIKTLNEKYGDKWLLEINCEYDKDTGIVEYDCEIMTDRISHVSVDFSYEELKTVLTEHVKAFYLEYRKKLQLYT